MASGRTNHQRQKGQALSETLVAFVVLVPLFIFIPYLGKTLSVKHKAQEGVRYAHWERSIFSDPGASWEGEENSKSDGQIRNEIRNRIVGDPSAPVVAGGAPSTNLLWQDHRGESLVPLEEFSVALNEEREPFPYGLAGRTFLGKPADLSLFGTLARDGLPILNQLDGFNDLIGGALDFNLGLNDRGFAAAQVTLPIIDLPQFQRFGATLDIVIPETTRELVASGSLLADPWIPGSEANYRERLDGMVIDEITSVLVAPGTFTFGFFPVFIEGLKGQNPTLESESNVLPERYRQDP